MSVLRSSVLLVAVVLLAVVAGCGGTATPGTNASVGAATTPAPVTQPPDDDGTDATNPPLVPATYTTGTLHLEVTGDVNKTLDLPLQANVSFTAEGSTILSYGDASGAGGGVILSADVNGFTVSSTEIALGGSNQDANVCAVVVTQSDASRVAGTIDCRGILGVVPSGTNPQNVTVDVRGTYEASR
jgi:hypothetical protein